MMGGGDACVARSLATRHIRITLLKFIIVSLRLVVYSPAQCSHRRGWRTTATQTKATTEADDQRGKRDNDGGPDGCSSIAGVVGIGRGLTCGCRGSGGCRSRSCSRAGIDGKGKRALIGIAI